MRRRYEGREEERDARNKKEAAGGGNEEDAREEDEGGAEQDIKRIMRKEIKEKKVMNEMREKDQQIKEKI